MCTSPHLHKGCLFTGLQLRTVMCAVMLATLQEKEGLCVRGWWWGGLMVPSFASVSERERTLGETASSCTHTPSMRTHSLQHNNLAEEAKDAIRAANDKRRTSAKIDF